MDLEILLLPWVLGNPVGLEDLAYQVLLEVLLVQLVLACKKMDLVQVLFHHLGTSVFVPKMAGCLAVVQAGRVGLEFQAFQTVLELQFLPAFLAHHLVLDFLRFQMTRKLQLEFHLVVVQNSLD
jgi:hypothetical protein